MTATSDIDDVKTTSENLSTYLADMKEKSIALGKLVAEIVKDSEKFPPMDYEGNNLSRVLSICMSNICATAIKNHPLAKQTNVYAIPMLFWEKLEILLVNHTEVTKERLYDFRQNLGIYFNGLANDEINPLNIGPKKSLH